MEILLFISILLMEISLSITVFYLWRSPSQYVSCGDQILQPIFSSHVIIGLTHYKSNRSLMGVGQVALIIHCIETTEASQNIAGSRIKL